MGASQSRGSARLVILSAAKNPTTQFRPHNPNRTSNCDCEVPHPEGIRGSGWQRDGWRSFSLRILGLVFLDRLRQAEWLL